MPIYEYQCKSCGHRLEKLQRMNDPVLTDCPACAKSELKRLVSAAAFRLKGSGWYETDFKKDGKKNLHDSGDEGDSTSKPDTSDAKSKTKSADSKSADVKSADAKSTNTKSKSKESGKPASKKTDSA
jgi:putative FmdB family regulatory protein